MADRNDKAGSSLRPPELIQQLNALDNQLYRLLCAYHFQHSVLESHLQHSEESAIPDSHWAFGLCVVNEWLFDSGMAVLETIETISQAAKKEA